MQEMSIQLPGTECGRDLLLANSGVLFIHDELTPQLYDQLSKQIQSLIITSRTTGKSPEVIGIKMCSDGGHVSCCRALYDLLHELKAILKCKLIGICYGEVFSGMADIVLQACDVRIAMPNATFMLHRTLINGSSADINSALTKPAIEYFKSQDKKDIEMLSNRTGKDFKFWDELIPQEGEVYFTAQEAHSVGLIDTIYGSKIISPATLKFPGSSTTSH